MSGRDDVATVRLLIGYGVERLPDGIRKALLRATAAQVFVGFAEQVLPLMLTRRRSTANRQRA